MAFAWMFNVGCHGQQATNLLIGLVVQDGNFLIRWRTTNTHIKIPAVNIIFMVTMATHDLIHKLCNFISFELVYQSFNQHDEGVLSPMWDVAPITARVF